MDEKRDAHNPGSSAGTTTVRCGFALTPDGLTITEVRISPRREDKLKAFVSITMNRCFVVRGIKIIEGRERLFVAMPSRSKFDGSFQDVVHPINQETRSRLEDHILNVYHDVMEQDPVP